MRRSMLLVAASLLAAPAAQGQDAELAFDGYVYRPADRPDPFVARRPWLEGRTAFEELALRGIVRTPKGYTALLVSPEGRAHFVTAGDRLLDGRIVAIDAGTVTFRPDVADPPSGTRASDLTKTLHAGEEAVKVFR